MNNSSPPPLPRSPELRLDPRSTVFIGLAIAAGLLVFGLIVCLAVGLIRPCSVPTGAMAPALAAGDHFMMEGFSFLRRKPRRGDIVVFRTDGIPSLPQKTLYVKRVAGESGDRVRITDGKLYVNDAQVVLSNRVGPIAYFPPKELLALVPKTEMVIPKGHYFMLGDNSTNSYDSRFWGSVPGQNILGRVSFCYGPPRRLGVVK
jgi:signal peptidase I